MLDLYMVGSGALGLGEKQFQCSREHYATQAEPELLTCYRCPLADGRSMNTH